MGSWRQGMRGVAILFGAAATISAALFFVFEVTIWVGAAWGVGVTAVLVLVVLGLGLTLFDPDDSVK